MLIIESTAKATELSPEETRNRFLEEYSLSKWKKILYIHMPHCPSKCKYCICKSKSSPNKSVVIDYVENTLLPQIYELSGYLRTIDFEEVYFGGGTPTYADAHLLDAVFNAIPNFERIPKKCLEGSPNTLTYEHLALLEKHKFSFLSVGIQSLQKNVCKWQNRFFATHDQIIALSDAIRSTGIYFNYDLICYLGTGDFRDNPGFEEDLDFLMNICKPSSINIHQHHQTTYTVEKMQAIFDIIRGALGRYPEYECINSRLLDTDALLDICYQAQYRLVREHRSFQHYMWNKFPEIPVKGFDIFSIGHIEGISPKSNAGTLVYRPGRSSIERCRFNDMLYDDFVAIRREKGLDGFERGVIHGSHSVHY